MSETQDDAQREHAAAVIAYREALAQLMAAKRHIPPSPRDRRRQRIREERQRQHDEWVARRAANPGAVIDENLVVRRALQLFAQAMNEDDAPSKPGQTLQIRMPVSYRINENDP